MNRLSEPQGRERSGERGSIIIITAIFMLLLFLMVGLCVDVSRIYMVRAELQNAADAAALSAARELNSGTTGIDDAVARANSIINNQGFDKVGVTIDKVEFAVNLYDDPYLSAADAKDDPTNIRFVKVTTQSASTNILFAVNALGTSHVEARMAVAGMSVGINTICDYFPLAIAKSDPAASFPTGVPIVLKFHDNTGTTTTLLNQQYAVLDTPWVTGNGASETRDAVAGVDPRCVSLGDVLEFSKSPSSNEINGPKQLADGTNTRFYEYPPGNQLTYDNAKPDANIYGNNYETITYADYSNGNSATRTSPGETGEDGRRILIIPIIAEIINGPPRGQIVQLRPFFLRQRIEGDPCPKTTGKKVTPCPPGTTAPGDIIVEYMGDDFVVGRGSYDPTAASTNLTVPVLYR